MARSRRGGKVLRFVVTGALLGAPAAGCGSADGPDDQRPTVNEPEPIHETVNEPAPDPEPDGPSLPEGEVVEEPEEDTATVNEMPEQEGEEPRAVPTNVPSH